MEIKWLDCKTSTPKRGGYAVWVVNNGKVEIAVYWDEVEDGDVVVPERWIIAGDDCARDYNNITHWAYIKYPELP